MGGKLERVEITFSDGTQETYTGDVIVFALEEGGVACRASFKCNLEEATKVAMSMIIQAGEIFKESTKQEGEQQIWSGGEKGEDFDFSKFL